MNLSMNKKEELLQQLAEIENQEREQLIKIEYPKFKQLIGKCFKLKTSYSCSGKKSDYWYVYSKIVSIRPDDLYLGGASADKVLARCKTITFQKNKYGSISINPNDDTYVHCIGEEISIDEFNKEFENIISIVNRLKQQ